jgi:Zn-dependent protease
MKSIRVGTVSGIRIEIHPTWFVIFFLITISLLSRFSADFRDQSAAVHWMLALLGSFLFFGSVLFHELSHSLTAQKLNRPVEAITLFVFGGVSWIKEEATTPQSEFLVSIVGPFSSFLLAGIFYIGELLFAQGSPPASLFHFLWVVNIALGVFNLVPAFPLDGGRVLRSILWRAYHDLRKATRRAAAVGSLFGYMLIVFGIVTGIGGGNLLNGLWLAFIGWFLASSADASVHQMELQKVFESLKAKDIIATDFPIISESLTLSELVDEYILPTGNRCFVVAHDGQLSGIISLHEVKVIPKEAWDRTLVRTAMKKSEHLHTITPDEKVQVILKIMDDEKINQLPVVEGNNFVGIVTRERLINMIRTRIVLEESKPSMASRRQNDDLTMAG